MVGKISEVHQTVSADIMPKSVRAIDSAELVSWEHLSHGVDLVILLVESREVIGKTIDVRCETNCHVHGDWMPQELSWHELLLPEEGIANLQQNCQELGCNTSRLSEGDAEVLDVITKSW